MAQILVSTAARVWAASSALCITVGGLAFGGAVLSTQGAWYSGYVSESGVSGQPYALEYRAGIFGVAAGLLLLAAALRGIAALAALVFLVSGLLAGVSGSVTCSRGCPLPPYQTPTLGDLLHGGSSVVGVGLCGLAALVLAVGRVDTQLRRVSRTALWGIIPLGALNAYGLAFVGRGYLTGLAERLILVLVLAWVLAVALRVARDRVAVPAAGGDPGAGEPGAGEPGAAGPVEPASGPHAYPA